MKSALPALLWLLAAPALAATPPLQHINPPTLAAPHGYTHVVAAEGGRMLFIAGQVPLDKDGKLVGAGDYAAQVRQTFENLKAALAAGGADFSNVVDMTTYVTDMAQIDTYRKIRNQYMSGPLPAASLVEVKGLFRGDVMLEISAIAVVPALQAPAKP
ncbi:RidA family protein [Dyella acidiphila]|uniref:RidA family protein n=1 Tax=Dyella acidiphila TaxID=2775866 RepID=A0ABR9G4W2_9GAMM|nr:RidA family protein [Dyella acidiphila]MBE1159093.1 RidA family protein [Dyella acidiphila]